MRFHLLVHDGMVRLTRRTSSVAVVLVGVVSHGCRMPQAVFPPQSGRYATNGYAMDRFELRWDGTYFHRRYGDLPSSYADESGTWSVLGGYVYFQTVTRAAPGPAPLPDPRSPFRLRIDGERLVLDVRDTIWKGAMADGPFLVFVKLGARTQEKSDRDGSGEGDPR
jgi:hypothetical protein